MVLTRTPLNMSGRNIASAQMIPWETAIENVGVPSIPVGLKERNLPPAVIDVETSSAKPVIASRDEQTMSKTSSTTI
jgi:hypothetical protein